MPALAPGLVRCLALAGVVACNPGTAHEGPTTGEATTGHATAGHSTGHAATSSDLPSTTLPTGSTDPSSWTGLTATTVATEPAPDTTTASTTASDETHSPPPPVTPFEIPLDQLVALGLGFVIDGPSDEAGIGYNIVPIADWNGDGVGELAFRSYIFGAEFGFVLFGGDLPPEVDLKDANQLGQAISIFGMGSEITPLGDINGDSLDDLGMDNNDYEVTEGDIDMPEGRVYAAWAPKPAADFDFLTLFAQGRASQVTGHLDFQQISRNTGAGDVNGDKLADMMFDAGGSVGILLGNPKPVGLTTQDLENGLGGYLIGTCGGDLLLRLGDINNDALDDLLAMNLGGTSFCVVYGKKDTQLIPFTSLQSGVAGFVVDASSDYEADASGYLGTDGDGMGDFDGDGFGDVVLLAQTAPPDRRVVILRGDDPWPLASFDAFRDAGRLRRITDAVTPNSVVFVPDLDEDGRDELLIGDVDSLGGSVSLVFGSPGVDPVSLDTLTATQSGIRFFNGSERSTRLGVEVATHDLTGDGVADLIMGEDGASPLGRTKAGRIYVVDGAALMTLVSTW